MTIYFMGSEPSALGIADEWFSAASGFDSNYSRVALALPNTRPARGPAIASQVGENSATGWWFHFRYVGNSRTGYANASMLDIYDENGWLTHRFDGVTSYMSLWCYQYQSSSYTAISNVAGWPADASPIYVDIHCYKSSGTDNTTDVYINNVLAGSNTHATQNNPGFKKADLFNSDTYQTCYASEFILADQPTVGHRVKDIPMTGNSVTHTAWTGDYQDIDAYNDDSGILSSALNQVETFTHAGLSTTQQGAGIAAISVAGMMSGNGTNDIQGVLRKSSTDYFSADLGVDESNSPHQAIWTSDPSTSGSWGSDDLTGVEFGVKSVT